MTIDRKLRILTKRCRYNLKTTSNREEILRLRGILRVLKLLKRRLDETMDYRT